MSSLEEQLAKERLLVARAQERVQNQLAFIEQLALDGLNTNQADLLLRTLLERMGLSMERVEALERLIHAREASAIDL